LYVGLNLIPYVVDLVSGIANELRLFLEV